MLWWVCSIKDHRWRQNVVRTLVTHSAASVCHFFYSYHILTSSVIYFWTHAPEARNLFVRLNISMGNQMNRGHIGIYENKLCFENISKHHKGPFNTKFFLVYNTLKKTLPTKTVLSLNWSFKKLKDEMVQCANDILEKRKCFETLRIVSLVI